MFNRFNRNEFGIYIFLPKLLVTILKDILSFRGEHNFLYIQY